MIANLILVILIKLVDQYTNTHSDNKKLINTDYSVLVEKN